MRQPLRRIARSSGLAALLVLGLLSVGMSTAAAQDGGGEESSLPTAIVSLGDSYISGEGGRWEGNSSRSGGDRRGTDRAAFSYWAGWYYDSTTVYEGGACHRSDVAPIHSTGIAVDTSINLACSGAESVNIFRASNGGQSFKGEAPQADQLATVAADYNVEMIVLSIGGNDLGFADMIVDCTVRYNTSSSWWKNTCNGTQQTNADNRMPEAMAGVAKAIDEIRAVMDAAGQDPSSYRLVLQSYASPIPRGSEFRYREWGWARTTKGGCPFWNVDATWARDTLVPQISSNLEAVAATKGVEFLDMSNAFEGREVCSDSASQGPGGATGEWGRFLVTGITQGDAQESMHPNAYGQVANGTCLGLMWAAGAGDRVCNNVAGAGPEVMSLG